MDRADLFQVFEFGAAIRPLSAIRQGDTLSRVFLPLSNADQALGQLMGTNPQAKVDLCLQAARDLKEVVDGIQSVHFREPGTDKFKYPDDASTKELEPWYVWQLERATQNFESVFQAEMQTAATYWVPKRGAYSTRDLVDHFERAFLPEMHDGIGDTALAEYRSSGRCFAFGLWSAAGYHACRAVESVLRNYYTACAKEDSEHLKNWGQIVDKLEKITGDGKPSEKTLFYIKQLKDNERNPLMHVQVVLDEQDADMLLNSSKVLIVLMVREIQAIAEKRASSPPLLQAIEGSKAASS